MKSISSENLRILIGFMAIAGNAVAALINDQSHRIESYPYLFYGSKFLVIFLCSFFSIFLIFNRAFSASKEFLIATSIFFICSGELLCAGYNLAYIQLVIFIPLVLNLPFKDNLFSVILSLVGFCLALAFGVTREINIEGYPSYFADVITSVVTSTCISFYVIYFVKKKENELNIIKQHFLSMGLETSMIVHNVKNELITPYRLLKESEEDHSKAQNLKRSIGQLDSIIRPKANYCSPLGIASSLAEKFRPNYPLVNFIVRGEEAVVPLSPQTMESIFSNIILNSISSFSSLPGEIEFVIKKREIIIKDNGPGFSKMSLEKLYKNDFHTAKSQGSGLGLINSRLILHSVGAEMYFYNENGAMIIIKF